MDFKQIVQREWHVALHAQTLRFRVIKYLILTILGAGMYWWQGAYVTLQFFGLLFLGAIAVHLVFRWKTDSWSKSWGPFKPLE